MGDLIDRALRYSTWVGRTTLELRLSVLTWKEWREALEIISEFYDMWDPVTLTFRVVVNTSGVVLGHGYMLRDEPPIN